MNIQMVPSLYKREPYKLPFNLQEDNVPVKFEKSDP